MPPEDRIRLRHMLEAIQQANRFMRDRRREDLPRDPQLLLALIKCIEIVGEAAGKVSPETQDSHRTLPWREIVAMRNRLIHVYFDVNPNIIWETVQHDLPKLQLELKRILDEVGE